MTVNQNGEFSEDPHLNKNLKYIATLSKKSNLEIAEIYEFFTDRHISPDLSVKLINIALVFNKTSDVVFNDYQASKTIWDKQQLQYPFATETLALSYMTGLNPVEVTNKFNIAYKESSNKNRTESYKIAEIALITGLKTKDIDSLLTTINEQFQKNNAEKFSNPHALIILETAAIASKQKNTKLKAEIQHAQDTFIHMSNSSPLWMDSIFSFTIAFEFNVLKNIAPEVLYAKKENFSRYDRNYGIIEETYNQADLNNPISEYYIRWIRNIFELR